MFHNEEHFPLYPLCGKELGFLFTLSSYLSCQGKAFSLQAYPQTAWCRYDHQPSLHLCVSFCSFSTPCRLRLCCCPGVVCRAGRPHHSSFWCAQAGHLRWILRGHQGPEEPRGQDESCSQQSWPNRDPAVDEGVRCPYVVPGKDCQHSWGHQGLHWLLLVPPVAHPWQSKAVWSRGAGPVQGYPEPSPQRSPKEAERPHQAGTAGQGGYWHRSPDTQFGPSAVYRVWEGDFGWYNLHSWWILLLLFPFLFHSEA